MEYFYIALIVAYFGRPTEKRFKDKLSFMVDFHIALIAANFQRMVDKEIVEETQIEGRFLYCSNCGTFEDL